MNNAKKLQKKLAKKKALLAVDTGLEFSDNCELVDEKNYFCYELLIRLF